MDKAFIENVIREALHDRKERPNISALARQFNVARRTIIRDVQELIRRGELPADIYPEWESGEEDGK